MLNVITDNVVSLLLLTLTIVCCRTYFPNLRYPFSITIPSFATARLRSSPCSSIVTAIHSRLRSAARRCSNSQSAAKRTDAAFSAAAASAVTPVAETSPSALPPSVQQPHSCKPSNSPPSHFPTPPAVSPLPWSSRPADPSRSAYSVPPVSAAAKVGAFNSTTSLFTLLSRPFFLSALPALSYPSTPPAPSSLSGTAMFSSWASRDTQQYLSHYPDQCDNPKLNDNLLFYSNQLSSRPDGALIEDILRDWRGQYSKLERHHGYVQWLFPLREEGMNSLIHPLQPHELAAILRSQPCRQRFLRAYELMLDFYGFTPSHSFASTGAISLQSVPRLRNLISSTHNYLRVTRILKSMGEFGYEQLKLGLVLALWRESRGERGTQYMRRSCDEYWTAVLRDERDREVVERVRQARISVREQREYDEVLEQRAEQRQQEDEAEKERKGEVETNEADRSAVERHTRKADARSRKQAASRANDEQDEDEEEVKSAAMAEDGGEVVSSVDEKEDEVERKQTDEQREQVSKRAKSTVPMSQEL